MVSFRSFVLSVALIGCESFAHPSHSVESSVNPNFRPLLKRALPQWQGFPPNDPRIAQITQAFKDMTTVVNTILSAKPDTFKHVFDNYFTDEVHDTVVNVFRAMVTPDTKDPTTGADVLENIIFLANNDRGPGACTNTPGYTIVGINGQPSQMHFCQDESINAFVYKSLTDISCPDLSHDVDLKMMTLGGSVLIHEMTHASEISKEALAGQNLPAGGTTDDLAYGPVNTRELKNGQGDFQGVNPPPKAVANADNYAWFATELYWTVTCKVDGQYFDAPESNNYAPDGVCKDVDAYWCAQQ